ncbi:MAG: hypothetical protein IT458_10810 [Planctomycetes bacterium]|nr:hypothetical protein [Planctomycetota bacterium]
MGTYAGLELAAEVEFAGTREQIEHDLIKLADVRAHSRLFVGSLGPWSQDEAAAIADAAATMMRLHDLAAGEWMVLALGPKGKQEDTEDMRIWKVTRDGKQQLRP